MYTERALASAREHDIAKACSVEELLADPAIEIVLNLTIPQAHYEVARKALDAGKSAYNEKPLTIAREEGAELVALAREKGLRLGGAPDTFLGGGIQTCRKLIDEGAIGRPVGFNAFMLCRGHEDWHPDPEFYYKPGGGPMFDMGPYYLTALVNLLGPVKRASGSATVTFPDRLITSEPRNGTKIRVEVPTHTIGTLEFANGATGVIETSFDIWEGSLPHIEIYGTEGSLSVPDPNGHSGPVKLLQREEGWEEAPLKHGYTDENRSIGVADMAYGIRTGREHRANCELSFHVLDIMHTVHDAAEEGRWIDLASTCERPAPLPTGLKEGELDE